MEEFRYVVENSKYVKIDCDKIDNFINALSIPKYEHWTKNLGLDLSENKWILLCTIIESMNFCFWKKPKWKIEYNNVIYSGSNALFYSIIKYCKKNIDFLDLEYLYNLDMEKFKEIFSSIEGEVPYINERYHNFREVVDYIYYNEKDFYNTLFSIQTDKELLNYIINTFSSFDDKSIYKDKTIHFNKRATLLTNDLYYVSSTIRCNIDNVNNLSGCADYGIPRTLRDYGIMIYNQELSNMVDNEEEILHNSEMEIEIRANMLYVIELIRERLSRNGININSVELDNVIWNMGKRMEKRSNSHHTITIYY